MNLPLPPKLWIILLSSTCWCAADDAPPPLEIVGPWAVEGSMKKKKEGVSAAASIDGRRGLLATDEGSLVQPFTIDSTHSKLVVGKGFSLLAGKEEMDIEAICAAPELKCYFVTGSHALGRNNGLLEEPRYRIYRIDMEAAESSARFKQGSLRPILESIAELKPLLDQPAAANGIDVEGLAWKSGKLFVGFRSPVLSGGACLLEVHPDCLFGDLPPAGKLHMIKLPQGTGIRSLCPVNDGLLLLTGDQGYAKTRDLPSLYLWRMNEEDPVALGEVPFAKSKPEALVLLSETATTSRVLMLSDGAESGAPVALDVRRRSPQNQGSHPYSEQ